MQGTQYRACGRISSRSPAASVAAAVATLGDPVQRLDGLVVAAPGGDDQRGPGVRFARVAGVGGEFGQLCPVCVQLVGQLHPCLFDPLVAAGAVQFGAHRVSLNRKRAEADPLRPWWPSSWWCDGRPEDPCR
ncbi:hypothetical protein [Micromonospora sp. Llam0]|uniref:hypothetical protein n=1 Tax=Micromonospora sp. Llam0 TaxID=2485143 RepID=UPI000F45FA12|nr:hypothetical protein [Micromonospora sp. Llam0]